MDKTDFNKEVKELRTKKGLSQKELANLSSLSLRTIQRIENDKNNPLGDTKRKIINILESYPDMNLSNVDKILDKKGILQKLATKWIYILAIYIFSLLGFIIGMIARFEIFVTTSLIIGFFCLFALSIVSIYHIKHKGWKKSIKHPIILLISIILYFLIIAGLFLPGKSTSIHNNNGVITKIERNFITGKSDTIITNEKDKEIDLQH